MQPELDMSHLVSPEEQETISLPTAAATRLWVEVERRRSRLNQLLGQEPFESPIYVMYERIVTSTPFVERILDTSKDATVASQTLLHYLRDELSDDLVDKYSFAFWGGISEYKIEEIATQLWSISSQSCEGAIETLRAVAGKDNTRHEFINDDAFSSVVRKSLSVEQYVCLHLPADEYSLAPQIRQNVIEILKDTSPTPEYFGGDRYRWHDHLDSLTDSNALYFLNMKGIQGWLFANRSIVRADINRMWGMSAINSLPGFLKRQLSEGRAS